MTALYVALTIWGGVWTPASYIMLTRPAKPPTAAQDRLMFCVVLVSSLTFCIGVCGLIGWALP
jgi:hypothetical protein